MKRRPRALAVELLSPSRLRAARRQIHFGVNVVVIAIEGLPGAGKTTSAALVARQLDAHVVRETTRDHPFLSSVYDDAGRDDLIVELAFLVVHAAAFRRLASRNLVVIDYSPVKDDLFALDMLDGRDYRTFRHAYSTLYHEPRPDIVVYLRVPPELCLERVRMRMQRDPRRGFEAGMTIDRLQRMSVLYEANLTRLGRAVVPLDIDASMDVESVVDRVVRALRPRLATTRT